MDLNSKDSPENWGFQVSVSDILSVINEFIPVFMEYIEFLQGTKHLKVESKACFRLYVLSSQVHFTKFLSLVITQLINIVVKVFQMTRTLEKNFFLISYRKVC